MVPTAKYSQIMQTFVRRGYRNRIFHVSPRGAATDRKCKSYVTLKGM